MCLPLQFDVSDQECFRNPMSGDKVGFTFELFYDDGKQMTVIPVPYDYENYWEEGSGRTDYKLDRSCERRPVPGDDVEFTIDSNGFPGRWSFGIRQSDFSFLP